MGENNTSELVGLLAVGVGVLVATSSEDLKSAIARGWGPLFDEATGRLEVAVTAPEGSATVENLASTGAIAVTASQPTTYRTMQLKGVVDRIDAPSQAQEERVQVHLERFIGEISLLGVDPDDARGLFLGDLVVVGFEVTGLFDQMPRSGAGGRLW